MFMDRQMTDERVSHKLDWSLTSRAKKIVFLTFLIQFDSFTKHCGNFSLINKMTENAKTCQNAYFEMAAKARTLLYTFF